MKNPIFLFLLLFAFSVSGQNLKTSTASPVPASAFSLGKLTPYAGGWFLPIIIDDKYSPLHQYLIRVKSAKIPADAPISLYGLFTSPVNGKPEIMYWFSLTDSGVKPGDILTVSGASWDANKVYTNFGAETTLIAPKP